MSFARYFSADDYRYKNGSSRVGSYIPDSVYRNNDGSQIGIYELGEDYEKVVNFANIFYTVSPRTKTSRLSRGFGVQGIQPAGKNSRLNDCRHEIYSQSVADPRMQVRHYITDIALGNGRYIEQWPEPSAAISQHLPIVNARLNSFTRSNRSTLSNDLVYAYCTNALSVLKPTLQVCSIAEDLFTLGQTRNLLKGLIPEGVRLPKAVLRNRGKKLNARRKYSRKILEYNYGWVPFYGSVVGTLNGLTGMLERVRIWQQQAADGIPFTRSTRKPLVSDSDYVEGVESLGSNDEIHWTLSRTSSVNASMIFTPRPCEQLNPLLDRFRQGLETLGIELNAGILWDLIPFSFVIDWFSNIGDVLHDLKVDAYELPIEMLDFCLAFRERIVITSEYHHNINSLGGVLEPLVYPTVTTEITSFDRYPLYPFPSGFLPPLEWKLPKLRHAFLALALVSAKTK